MVERMSNGNQKTILTRRALEWDDFIMETIEKIREVGYPEIVKKPEIERLFLRHKCSREIQEAIVNGFKGIKKVNVEVESWMKGKK